MRLLSFLVTFLLTVLVAACGGGGGSPGTVGAAQTLFTAAPANLTLGLGGAQSFQVGGGKAPYVVSSGDSTVVAASVSDSALTLGGVSPGSATVTIRDSAGATASVVVTVKPTRALFTTAPSDLTIALGQVAQTYQVGGGVGPYTVISNNPSAISAALSGTTLAISGLAVGVGNVQVTDSVGATVVVAVTVSTGSTVSLFTTAAPAVTLSNGTSATFTVGGGVPPYTATSANAGIATPTLSGTGLTINAIATGATTIVIRDSAGTSVSAGVTVVPAGGAALFTTAPLAIALQVGAANAQTYSIGGGTAPYTATSSNVAVASAVASGGALTITGITNGAANVVIRDSAGAALTVAVTVSAGQLTISPAAATALVGDTLFATISGGSGSYSALVTNQAVAIATITGNTLRVDVKQQSTSVPIVITDLVTGASTQFTLTSAPGQTQIQLSPNALTISELSAGPITLQVFGSAGSVTAFSSDTGLLQASASGNVVTIDTGSNGKRCVPADTTVTISVIDAGSALATSVITIKDTVVHVAPCP